MTLAEFINVVGFKVKDGDISKVNNSINTIKNTAQKALGAIGISLSIAGITSVIKDCVSLASEAEEMQNKFDVVFQGMNETVEEWAKNYSDAIGRNANDIKTYMADMQNLVVGFMGTDMRQEAYELTQSMTTLALDLASFNNIDEGIAVNAMQKAVMGESEAAKTIGAVLNDVTRAEAMHQLGLKGKYDALDQATKMMVNYQAILLQSTDAVGDCERSLGSYRSTLIAFQSKLKEIKTIVGQFFMPTAQKILQIGTKGLTVVRNWVQNISDFAEELGGAHRIITIIGGALAGMLLVRNLGKVAALVKVVVGLLSPAKLLIAAIAAAFTLVALVVEDFFAFVQGKDSLFGDSLKKAGIDLAQFRTSILLLKNRLKDAFGGIKDFAGEIGTGLFNALQQILPIIVDFVVAKGPGIIDIIKKVAPLIGNLASGKLSMLFSVAKKLLPVVANVAKTLSGHLVNAISTLIPFIGNLASSLGGFLLEAIQTLLPPLVEFAMSILPVILSCVNAILPVILEFAQAALPIIIDLINQLLPVLLQIIEAVLPVLLSCIEQLLPIILQLVQELLPIILEVIMMILPLLVQVIEAILPAIMSFIEELLPLVSPLIEIIANLASSILPVIITLLESILPILEPILGILQPIADVLAVIIDALGKVAGGIATGIQWLVDAVTGGGSDTDASSTVPGYAVGTDYSEDTFVAGENGPELITGQRGKKVFTALQTGSIFATAKEVISAAIALSNIRTARPATAANVTSSQSTRNVFQNVSNSNQFNGDKAIQRQAANTMGKSANDITRELARGLAYAR